MSYLSQLAYPVLFKPKRRLASFTEYMTIEESGEDELVITEHPVQSGAEITDHAYKKNPTLSVRIQFSQSEITTPLDEIYRRMLELQDSRVPFEVVTGKRLYDNMLFQSLGHSSDKNTNNVLAITATLKHIKITQVTTVSVPARAKQAQPGRTGATENAGQKRASEVAPQDQEKRKSALKSISGNF